jgi:hypothetical protein
MEAIYLPSPDEILIQISKYLATTNSLATTLEFVVPRLYLCLFQPFQSLILQIIRFSAFTKPNDPREDVLKAYCARAEQAATSAETEQEPA